MNEDDDIIVHFTNSSHRVQILVLHSQRGLSYEYILNSASKWTDRRDLYMRPMLNNYTIYIETRHFFFIHFEIIWPFVNNIIVSKKQIPAAKLFPRFILTNIPTSWESSHHYKAFDIELWKSRRQYHILYSTRIRGNWN